MSRILYLVPECNSPSGGMNTIFEHVALLDSAGFSASVLQMNSAAPYQFSPVQVPTTFLDQGMGFAKDDVLVMPESTPDFYRDMAAIPDIHRLVFCQNHFYFIHLLGERADLGELGLAGVIGSSGEIASFLGRTLNLPQVPVIPYAIDTTLFQPGDKKLQIAHMPRKMAQETVSIKNMFSWRYPELADIPWVPIDGVSKEQAAHILGESALYLSTSWYEGLGLPPLEAMAAGCLVVGFHGWGGLDFVEPSNGLWCEEGNIDVVPDALAAAVNMVRENDPAADAIRSAAMSTVARYSPEARDQALFAFWNGVLGSAQAS